VTVQGASDSIARIVYRTEGIKEVS
jgi:hypothetical protein